MRDTCHLLSFVLVALLAALPAVAQAQTPDGPTAVGLEDRLLAEGVEDLARAARREGDPERGAAVFYQRDLACAKCHLGRGKEPPLGPDLARPREKPADAYLVEAVLAPSKTIQKGYAAVTVVSEAGDTVTGPVAEDNDERLVLRDANHDGRLVAIAKGHIDQRHESPQSLMPAGLANLLADRRQFLDLVRYLMEIARLGPVRARELRPPEALITPPPLPEYERHIDHAGMIAELAGDAESLRRGEAIYNRVCVNCHGSKDRPGSLPTSLRFASGRFKNGADPLAMYRTLTYGFGLMQSQPALVPRQKYDVIHYIREAYLKPFNPTQHSAVDAGYLARLPRGTSRGPEATSAEPWAAMDYGPSLMATYEIGSDGSNFAYKGIAVRLDAGAGGVARGRHWLLYDHDTLGVAGAWSGEGFIDFNGINFNGRHETHPRVVGQVEFANPVGPGWANPADGSFDDPRMRGRDDRPYGPLPRGWAHYRGLYHHGNRGILSYTVGESEVLELPGLQSGEGSEPLFTRTFDIGPRPRELVLQVAREPGTKLALRRVAGVQGRAVEVAVLEADGEREENSAALEFTGNTYLEIDRAGAFEMTEGDYTVSARIQTTRGGTILARTAPGDEWVPDGKALFVRGGKLVFDIGWVGAVESRRQVDDGRWHDVALVWQHRTGRVRLFVDGKLDGSGRLKPREEQRDHVLRIGYAAPDFPQPNTFFQGRIAEVRFYAEALSDEQVAALPAGDVSAAELVARWKLNALENGLASDTSGHGHDARFRMGSMQGKPGVLIAGTREPQYGAEWLLSDEGDLRLKLPSGNEPLRFTLWLGRVERAEAAGEAALKMASVEPAADLAPLTQGGPPRWPERLVTEAQRGDDAAPLAVDGLTLPDKNPWACQLRTTGFDFLPGGRQAAVCTWDGDVWLVDGLSGDGPTDATQLVWRRIASGLFQPLGLKVVEGRVYVGCRDQIVVLRDLNGDGETDFYECFNSDHQVTEHFHEFAMDLQTDEAGNFYYAKAARHGKTALVPQHGTLLRVGRDGSRTDILATGFRAPNGVCVNADGTFFLTDQEGHWTPKNRINWVREGGFYGNMWGYHDVTDAADSAAQPPLCWITNRFDRSPAELVWVPRDAWGVLAGSLLNFSYGYGRIFVVLPERVGERMQGGMAELPLAPFPTGIMRGRFHPVDRQLYTCGMFAWAGDQQQPGGFYRVRYTGRPLHVPLALQTRRGVLEITFSDRLEPAAATDTANYRVKVWGLKRSANYGSEHYDEHFWTVFAAKLTAGGRQVVLEIPELAPTQCMQITYALRSASGEPVEGSVHDTIHELRTSQK